MKCLLYVLKVEAVWFTSNTLRFGALFDGFYFYLFLFL